MLPYQPQYNPAPHPNRASVAHKSGGWHFIQRSAHTLGPPTYSSQNIFTRFVVECWGWAYGRRMCTTEKKTTIDEDDKYGAGGINRGLGNDDGWWRRPLILVSCRCRSLHLDVLCSIRLRLCRVIPIGLSSHGGSQSVSRSVFLYELMYCLLPRFIYLLKRQTPK